jgi:hypothetical protein
MKQTLAVLVAMVVLFSLPAIAQKNVIPERLLEYLLINKAQGIHPSSIEDLRALNHPQRRIVSLLKEHGGFIVGTQIDTITASAVGGGTISPFGTILLDYGDSTSFYMTANPGNMLTSVYVDSVNVGAPSEYQFDSVETNHTITAYFAPTGNQTVDTIYANANGLGTIFPFGAILVDSGGSATFTMQPNAPLLIVMVDGYIIGNPATYTFNDVNADHVITAYYAEGSVAIDSTTFTVAPINLPGIVAGTTKWFDYNNSGYLGAIIVGTVGPYWANVISRIYQNNNGYFTDINANLQGNSGGQSVAWGDVDNNGTLALFVVGSPTGGDVNNVATLYHNVNGVFVADTINHFMGLSPSSATFVDYDNDGQLDIFYTGSPDLGQTFYSLLYHNNNGVFTLVDSTGIIGAWGTGIDWGDYNNDGYPDLLFTGFGGTAYSKVYQNDSGSGVFTDIGANLQPVNSSAVKWFDYDNDGNLDILLTGVAPGDIPTAKIYHNDGNGVFTDINAALKPVAVSAVAVGDYDNDGYLDVAISGSENFYGSQNLTTKIYHNDGQGHFIDINADIPGAFFGDLSWGDYDNDGRLDLIVSGASWSPTWSENWDNAASYPFTIVYHNNSATTNAPPTVPSSVNAVIRGAHSATINWGTSTDAHTPTKALTYNIRVGTTPGGIDVVAPASTVTTGHRRKPDFGNASHQRSRTFSNLPAGTYYYSVQAVDNAYAGSHFTVEQSFTIGGTTTGSVWQLISAPIRTSNSVANLYPTAKSNAYLYADGYQPEADLTHGVGYWLQFPNSNAPTIAGLPVLLVRDTIHLNKGWNLIGSVSGSVSTSSLVTNPAGIIQTSVFGYNQGYVMASSIEPFKGYWVKSSAAGELILNGSGSAAPKQSGIDLSQFSTLTIKDGDGNEQTLYFGTKNSQNSAITFELPPPAPAGVFDVRYSSNNGLELASTASCGTIPITISSATYPLTLSWNNSTQTEASIVIGGKSKKLEGPGNVKIISASSQIALQFTGVAMPTAFALAQNYPNPFNPTTTINYALPVGAKVRLVVYNALGQMMATLVDGQQSAGWKSVKFDGSKYASGVYLIRLDAVSVTDPSKSFSDVRKMAFIK